MRDEDLPGEWGTEAAIRIVRRQSGVKLTVRQLQGWHRKRVVVAEERGPRNIRFYGFQNIRRLCIIAGLLKAGFPRNRLRNAIRNIDQAANKTGRSWDELRIVTDGNSIFVVNGDKGIEALTGQVASFILLGDLRREARDICQDQTTRRLAGSGRVRLKQPKRLVTGS